ncbi:hypothetical protein OAE40_01490 [Rubripirellula sp.]|nr:hypothetical protein [Rubripirellula sp.]
MKDHVFDSCRISDQNFDPQGEDFGKQPRQEVAEKDAVSNL